MYVNINIWRFKSFFYKVVLRNWKNKNKICLFEIYNFELEINYKVCRVMFIMMCFIKYVVYGSKYFFS